VAYDGEKASFEETLPAGYGWLVSRLSRLEVTRPTEVQRRAIPAALRDVLALAKAGSGTTIAFGLPMATHVASRRLETSFPDDSEQDGARPLALCLSPTRGLCEQTYRTLRAL